MGFWEWSSPGKVADDMIGAFDDTISFPQDVANKITIFGGKTILRTIPWQVWAAGAAYIYLNTRRLR